MSEITYKEDWLDSVLTGLRSVLENEKAHLKSGRMDLLEVFAREKMQILASLDRFARNNNASECIRDNRAKLEEIDLLLKDNMNVLGFRMKAISEISKTIEDAAVEAESDGTYEAGGARNISWR